MTLARLRSENKNLFCPQDWYLEEPFMQIALPRNRHVNLPEVMTGVRPNDALNLPHAIELAALYIECPDSPVFDDYLWTCDFDRQGQRIYVGGCANGRGFELHRHLHITKRWGIPKWPS